MYVVAGWEQPKMTRGLCNVGVVEVAVENRSDQLLPDPEPRPVEVTIISVDDHLVEPPTCSRVVCPLDSPRINRGWSRMPKAISCGSSMEGSTRKLA
jgi:hypothetical protein